MKFVAGDDPALFEAAIDEKTKAVYVETIGNPQLNVCSLREISDVCIPLMCFFPLRVV